MNKKSTNKSMPLDNRPPKHLRTLKRGDIREDGMIFFSYNAHSRTGERWMTKDDYNKMIKNKAKIYKSWAEKNRDHLRDYHYKRRQRPTQRLINSQRARVCKAMRQISKSDKTINLIGCSAIELKDYLESLFIDGMSWENYGSRGWHVDHIRPCASFDLSDPEQQEECFHYTNLQPLWAEDNESKGTHYNPQTED